MNCRRFLLVAALLCSAALLIAVNSQREPAADGKPITYWLENLDDYDPEEPSAAAIAIRKIGTNALPWMLREMKWKKSAARQWIEEQMKRQSLIRFQFEDEDEHHSHATIAFRVLGEVGAPTIPDLLQLLAVDHDVFEVSTALENIGPRSIEPLVKALADTNAVLRQNAAFTLGGFDPEPTSGVPALLICLNDANGGVRSTAAETLGKIGIQPLQVVPELVRLLEDSERDVRLNAAFALCYFGSQAEMAIEPLLKLVADKEADIQEQAAGTLGCIGRRADLVIPVLLTQWDTASASLRDSIARSLGDFPDKADDIIPILFAAAEDQVAWRAAIGSLGKLKSRPEKVVPFLLSLLKSQQPHIRYYAVCALANFGDTSDQTISALKELLNDNTEFWNGSMGKETVSRAAKSALLTLQRNQTQ